MQIKIGPYRNWIGPYQIADVLQFVGVSEDRCFAIGTWLSKTWVADACAWYQSKQKREQYIKIDKYDTWSMDNTLTQIIAPMLRQLQKTKNGAPYTDDEDVPDYLKSTAAPPKENDWDTDANHFLRWDWILNEMIWTFEQSEGDNDWEAQYHTGVNDIAWKDLPGEPGLVEMVNGPKDTHKFDIDGFKKHAARIQNGHKLFGKYFSNLWD